MSKGTILIGATGCIAAYKACEVVRALQRSDFDVEVVMTENAAKFVGPLTFEALTNKPVRCATFGDPSEPIPHIATAERADLFVIVPCTANILAKIACGIADDLVTSIALAAHDRMVVAPAMNVHMYVSPSVQANLELLKSRGVMVIEPDQGYLACGDTGKGRLAPPEEIASRVMDIFNERKQHTTSAAPKASDQILAGKTVLITAGPTRERIDPVRYITNDSSGKMGYAIARAARDLGAHVTLVSGPVSIERPAGVDIINVESAHDMYVAAKSNFDECDIAIFSAAVADMRPKSVSDHKLKKSRDRCALETIELVENEDILASLASTKHPDQFVVGFAAETNDVLSNARSKLVSKGADMIVANEVGEGKAFGKDELSATLITLDSETPFESIDKNALAFEILNKACAKMS